MESTIRQCCGSEAALPDGSDRRPMHYPTQPCPVKALSFSPARVVLANASFSPPSRQVMGEQRIDSTPQGEVRTPTLQKHSTHQSPLFVTWSRAMVTHSSCGMGLTSFRSIKRMQLSSPALCIQQNRVSEQNLYAIMMKISVCV